MNQAFGHRLHGSVEAWPKAACVVTCKWCNNHHLWRAYEHLCAPITCHPEAAFGRRPPAYANRPQDDSVRWKPKILLMKNSPPQSSQVAERWSEVLYGDPPLPILHSVMHSSGARFKRMGPHRFRPLLQQRVSGMNWRKPRVSAVEADRVHGRFR